MDKKECGLCQVDGAKYVCPKCGIMYCSVECFRSPHHVQCAELFYEKCVKDELQFERADPDSRKKMLEILKNVQEENDLTDSDDDDDDEQDLCERMENVDLNDEDQIWKKLTPVERREFKKLISSGAITKLLPDWRPWWKYCKKKKLITEMDAENEIDIDDCPYPQMDVAVVPLAQLTKKTPHQNIPFMVINTFFSYVTTARWFKGQHREMPVEGATTLFALSSAARRNAVFGSLIEAFVAFEEDLSKCKWITPGDVSRDEICDDVADLIKGVDDEDLDRVRACLCDVHRLLERALTSLGDDPHVERFTGPPPRRTELKMFAKKVTYYLSWSEAHGKQLKESLVRGGLG